jgi:PAS domain S-box-containing protein
LLSELALPSGGGTTGDLLRRHDWSATPLGDASAWPQPLRTLAQVMLASNQPMFIVWGPQRTLLYNQGYSHILGIKHPGALGRDFLDVWHEIRADLLPIVNQAYEGEPVQMDDIELVMHRHGYPEETHFSFFYSPIRGDEGHVEGFFCACNEITAQVRAQRELRRSEERRRSMLANMDEAFMLLDRDFTVLEVNDEAVRLDGRTAQQLIGCSHWELYPGSEQSEFGRMYRRVLASARPAALEQHYRWPNGRDTWMEVRAYPTSDGLALFFRDVTGRRAIAEAAAVAAERVQLALDAGAIVGTWVWYVPANHFTADERFARAFGVDPALCREGVPLERMMNSIHEDDRDRVSAAIAEAMARGGPYRCQYRVRQSDGVYRWIEANGRVELDEEGKPLRFPGVLLDVEDRLRVQAERDQANALLRTFIEAVPGVVYAKDREGRMLVANRGVAELVGKPPEAFLGKTDAEFLADKAQAAVVMANDRRIMESGQKEQVEEEVRLPDGSPAYWLSTKEPMRDAQGRVIGLIGASVDITERKREQERARTEAEMLDLLNQTGAALAAELELEALLQSVTDAATKLTGAQFGAFFYNGVDAQGDAYVLYALSGAPREAFDRLGHPRPTPVFAPTFRGGPPVRIDDVRADPRYGQWAPHHGMPAGHLPVRSYLAVSVTSRGGDVIGGLFFGHAEPGVFTERSERLAAGIAAQAAVGIDNARLYAQAQRAAAERKQLLESERAARAEAERASTLKDEFLATLSHELRTPLSAITGWVHILRRKLDAADPALRKGVDVIERSTRVQTQLIEDLLDMSRITSGKLRLDPQPVAAAAFVQAAIDTLRPSANAAGVRIRAEIDDPQAPVVGDAARLQQVVWNLLSNAVKFSVGGGEVLVELAADARQVRIAVSDSGVGIQPAFLPYVFDRFRQADGSTTRRHGGLGLGLSIVRHLVELHGGSVSAASAGPGKGSRFEVVLPRSDAAGLPAGESVRMAADDADLSGLRILVVDDEPDVRDLLLRVLSEARAEVVAAAGATEAIALFRQHRPQVVVSDIGMPDIDGYALVAQLHALQAGIGRLAVIGLSAFARPEDRRRALHAGFDLYLAKPIDPQVLVGHIAQLAPAPDAQAHAPEPRS